MIDRAGSYEQLKIKSFDEPEVSDDKVLIDVQSIGVNYADCIVRMGLYKSARDYVGWPITPGFEVAGTIAKLGPKVEGFQVGDEVIGVTRFDGYASQICVPQHQVFAKPKSFSMDQAAAFPSVFLTASFALFDLGHPREGQDLLVHSAAGGVGGALVQLGKIAGGRVIGVVGGSHKVDAVKALGAAGVIDKSTQDLWREAKSLAPRGYQLIFDANGVETLGNSYAHLRAPGRLIIYGFHTMMPKRGGKPNWLQLIWGWLRTPRFNPLNMTSDNKSVLAFNLSYLFEETGILKEHMDRLLAWIDEGRIQSPKVTSYAFKDVAQAHRDLESGKTVGKLVLNP